MSDTFDVVVKNSKGQIKDTRFVKSRFGYKWEFIPNNFYLSLINSGRIQPNKWKLPLLLGKWTATKENTNGNS